MEYYEGMRVKVRGVEYFTSGHGCMTYDTKDKEWAVRFDDYETYIDEGSLDFHDISNHWVVEKEQTT